jgi:hypothetical protein
VIYINSPMLIRPVLVLLLASALTHLPAHAPELRGRVISQARVEAGRQSPVHVVSVSFKGEAVEPGRQFLADDEWLLGLTFRVKNVSDRPVSYVGISLRVPKSADQKNKYSEFVGPYVYGCAPTSPCRPDAKGAHDEIMPGETRDVALAEGAHKGMTAVLIENGASAPIMAAEYDIESVFFDAGTMWSRGFLFRRDPSEPSKYRMGGKYELPGRPK